MRRWWILVAVAAFVGILVVAQYVFKRNPGLSGDPGLSADAWTALREAKSFEIVSLDPNPVRLRVPDMLYAWKVLGRARVTSDDLRQNLIEALEGSITDDPIGAKCFLPRHAIRVAYDGHDYDVLLCFECNYVYWYADGKKLSEDYIDDDGLTAFNQVFTDAGLPIAP